MKRPTNDYIPQPMVLEEHQIILEGFEDAFNPSIISIASGYLMSFRYCPDRSNDALSLMGIVELDQHFQPISGAQILDTRSSLPEIPSHSEDPRLLQLNGKLYVLYNDVVDSEVADITARRDMFWAELVKEDEGFILINPMRLTCPEKKPNPPWEKNWVPFVCQDELFLSYYPSPHEVLKPDLLTGICSTLYKNSLPIPWKYDIPRGGTPALLIDDVYLAFFHSRCIVKSPLSLGKKRWHYFIGAYTFMKEPPFTVLEASPQPIVGTQFYTKSKVDKHVVFPGGFVDAGPHLILAYGKNDREIWIAKIDKILLKQSLKTAGN